MKRARDFMVEVPHFPSDEKVTRVRSVLRDNFIREAYVHDEKGRLLGYVDITAVLRVPATRSDVTVEGFVREVSPALPDDPVERLVGRIRANGTDSVPIVDEQGKVLGGVLLSDIFPVITSRHPLAGKVKDFMTGDVVTCETEDTVTRIYNLIVESGYSAIPVMKRKRLVGIISRSDLLRDGRWRPSREGSAKTKVESVMKTPVITVAPDDDLQYAAGLLVKHDVSRLPVLDGECLVGILDRHDVLKAVPREG
ncbi:MAG: CBS domain-containing protein [Methanolinea sp.]|nr:CBS domain-containing protein [Methanolinea sp.]